MYSASLTIELIGLCYWQQIKEFESFEADFFGTPKSMPPYPGWCARLSIDDRFRINRSFLRGRRDYSQSNSKGSRGVREVFLLEDGGVYEAEFRTSWKSRRRMLFKVVGPEKIEITREEALELISRKGYQCQKDNSDIPY